MTDTQAAQGAAKKLSRRRQNRVNMRLTATQLYHSGVLPLEHHEQVTVIQWAERNLARWPQLRMLLAIPNGGGRSTRQGQELKNEGVKPGVPDLQLAHARAGYHGLFIEMKRRKGAKLSDDQRAWIDALKEEGYCVVVAEGCDIAIHHLILYLNSPLERVDP